jgi:DNA-binding NarL/FixJ family response regulator
MYRVLIVDDHRLFREGLKLVIAGAPDFIVGGEAGTAREALHLVETTSFDLLVADVTMPGTSGLSMIRELHRRNRGERMLVVSMHDEPDRIADALIAGATAYVLKSDTPAELLDGLRAAAAGTRFLSPSIDARAVERLVLSSGNAGVVGPLDRLTAREREIFLLIARDYSTAMIATELGISPKTVETHREHIFRKLHIHSICELVRFAARHHLLEWESHQYTTY